MQTRGSAGRVRGRMGQAVLALRSSLFALGQILITLLFVPIVPAAVILPYRSRYRVVVQWALLNIWWLGVSCGLRHRVKGLENIPERAAIVLCKHQSAWEALVLPRYFSPLTWVLKRELLLIPFFGWGLASLRPIAIDRSARQSGLSRGRPGAPIGARQAAAGRRRMGSDLSGGHPGRRRGSWRGEDQYRPVTPAARPWPRRRDMP